ncbi:MAG: DUF4384 domain-containing protein [Candidatus Kryptonium sp.]|nr:DUF4384 domain-containing protein [Candidatus Kryptonium sp.]
MKNIILILLSFVFSSFVFASEKPAWITTKKHPRYPERLYILGVGAAKKTKNKLEDIQKANNEAFADIVKQIRVTVASKSVVEQMEVIAGKKVESIERASAELQVTSELKIGGLKIVETYFDDDDDIYYSLAVLDRETAGRELKDMLNQFHNGYSKNFELARNNIIRGNIYQALLNLAESYKNIPPYNDILPLYRFITRPLAESDLGNEWKVADALLTAEIKSIAQDLFSKLKIEKLSGEEQEVVFNQVLKPLFIKVVYIDDGKSYPVSGIKFKFAFQTGIGKLSDRGTSDNSGTVKCDIFELKPHRENYYVVSAKLDLSEFYISGRYDEYAEWNDLLRRNEKEIIFTLRRTAITLDDKIRDLVLNLVSKIPLELETVSVLRIYYQDKLPGPMALYLKQKIESAIEQHTKFSLISDEQIKMVNVKYSNLGYSSDELGTPESFGKYAGSKVVITGNYWESGDGIDLNLKATDVLRKIVLSTANVNIPRSFLPNIPLVPENYNPKVDDEIIKSERKGEDLKVEVWVDRPDGIYYEGDSIRIFVRANKDCYIQLVYYDAHGNAILVFPHKMEWNNKIEGGKIYRVPGNFVIEPPFGREILKVFASEKPFPLPTGREYSGLILIENPNLYASKVRGIGLKTQDYSGGYAEHSVVITTLKK